MSLPAFAYAGARAPEAIQITVSPSDTVPDLTVVTAASIVVTRPDGSTVTWTPTLSNKAPSTLTLTHVFASDGTDVPHPGTHSLACSLTTPSGMRRLEPGTLKVLAWP